MKKLFIALMVTGFSAGVMAETTPSYSYVGVEAGRVQFGNDTWIDGDGDIGSLYGSYEVSENFHVLVGYAYMGTEIGNVLDYESHTYGIGGGVHGDISPTMSLDFNLMYSRTEVEIDSREAISLDDETVSISFGIRNNITDDLEINASLTATSVADDEIMGLTGGFLYTFSEGFGVSLMAHVDELDSTAVTAGIRYTF